MSSINEIINYATHNPENTNSNVLRSMLMNSSTIDLPEIGPGDEGKFLGVVDGSWDKMKIEDGTLPFAKLVQGECGYVTPEQFGAVGDGQTNDTAAIQAAIDTHLPVVFGYGKTYIALSFTLYNGCKLYGNGAILKRPNLKEEPYNYTDAQIKGLRMFSLGDGTLGENVNDLWIEFRDLTIDTNAFEMWSPNDEYPYRYEQGVCMMCSGSAAHHRKLYYNNCTFLNNYASNIAIANYTDIIISNSRSLNCFKGICTVIGSGGNLQLSNCYCNSNYDFMAFWYEPNSNSNSGYTVVNIDNCVFYGGFQGLTTTSGTLNISNTFMKTKYFVFVPHLYTIAQLNNCTFVNTGNDPIGIRGNGKIIINNCDFTSDNNTDSTQYKKGLLFIASAANDYNTTAIINNCIFHNLTTGIIFDHSSSQHFKVQIDNCYFKDITERTIGANLGYSIGAFDYCYISNCIFDVTGYVFYVNGGAGEKFPVFNGGNDVVNPSNLGIHGYGSSNIIFKNEMWSVPVTISKFRTSSEYAFHGIGKRVTLMSEAPTSAFVGVEGVDFVELTVSPYTKYEYTNGSWVELQ